MTRIPSNHIEGRRSLAFALKADIMRLLDWTDLQYSDHQYQSGLLYIKTYLPGNNPADSLAGSKLFWSWWRNQWALRDETFLDSIKSAGLTDAALCRRLYVELNNGAALTTSIRPNRIVLDEISTVNGNKNR